MSVKELNALIKCHRDMTFEQFCKEIYPDFHLKFSQPYLEGKYSRFQHHFMSFLKELDEQHLAYFANCLEKQNEQQKKMIDLTPYTMILVSLSGGKDSLCIALETVKAAREQGVFHRLMAVHCDTDAEWFETPSVVRNHCRLLDIPLQIVYPHRGIPDYIEQRGMFPCMSCRFCTSLKTSAIEKFVRNLYPAKKECKILSVTGERREESPHRAKLCEFEIHHTLTAGKRQVFHYRPILDWNVAKVWDTINKSGIPPHPAYTGFGNERLSCALCMFACEKDLRNGARNRPDLVQRYLEVERRTGFTFRYKQSLKDILSGGDQQCSMKN